MTRDEQMHFHLNAALTALRRVRRRPSDIYTVKRNIEAAMMLLEPPARGPMRPMDDVISELGEEIEKMRRLIMAEVVRRLGPPVLVEDEGEEA